MDCCETKKLNRKINRLRQRADLNAMQLHAANAKLDQLALLVAHLVDQGDDQETMKALAADVRKRTTDLDTALPATGNPAP